MKQTRRLRQLVRTLPPKQQTLDFGQRSPWLQLPTTTQEACRDAVAALLYHVTTITLANNQLSRQETDEHER